MWFFPNLPAIIISGGDMIVKKLPIGVNDFSEMIEGGYYFVDKTMLIKDVVDLPGKIKLITRPRRFGKTLNMNMIRSFFSREEKKDLFEGLKIWEKKGFVKEYYHKYPVVFVSFKEVKDVTWKNAVSHMRVVLSNLAMNYSDFEVKGYAKEKLEKIINMTASDEAYADSLRFLTQLLHETTGKKAILLIDEYDVPIEAAYTYRHRDENYYENMVAFMRNMLTAALKDNEHLEFGILTGVYRVAKESIFSGLNNLEVFTVFDSAMEERFGFTEKEITEMLCHYNLGKEDKKIIDEWYGGYKVGEYQPLYNPWSVIKYISERVVRNASPERAAQPFWINTSSNDIVKQQIEKNPQIKSELDVLLERRETLQSVDPWLSLRELEEVPEGVWTLFVSGGYLTATRQERGMYLLKIVNKEVEEFFKVTVKRWLSRILNMNVSNLYVSMVKMLKEGETEQFVNFLEKFIKNTLSYYDFGFEETERVYKAFLLGILSIALNGYIVESELESGYGRLDVVVYPKEKRYGKYAAIFEVKKTENEEKLEEMAEKALQQIKEGGYYAKMKHKSYEVIGFGIAFCGKKASIRTAKLIYS